MKLIFELVAQDVNVGIELQKQRDALKALNKELKGLEQGTEEYEQLRAEAVKTKLAISDLTDQQKKLNNELKATKVPKDSLAGLRIEYSKLSQQVSLLSKAERESDFGKALIKNAEKVKVKIDGIEQSIGRFTGNVGNYKSAFDAITGFASKFTAALAVIGGGGAIIDATRQSEKLFAVLNNAVGNETGSLKIFESIKTFALETPFQLNEIVESFVKLEQRNFNPTIEQLRAIGDIAASQGKTINQFTEAILDAQTGEFERLKEFGIVAKKNGDQVSLSFRGQTKTISNTSEEITKYLLELAKLPGVSGAASSVAATLDGAISNLTDNFTQLLSNLGSSGGILNSIVNSFSSIVSVANDLVSIPLSEKLQEQQTEFNALVGILQNVNIEETTRKKAIDELQAKYGDYIGNINLEKASQEELSKVLEQGNKLFLQRIFLQQNEEKFAEFAKRRIDLERKLFEQRKEAQKFDGGAQGTTSGIASALVGTSPLFTINEINQLENEQKEFQQTQDELAKSLFGTIEAAKGAGEEYKKLGEETKSGSDKTNDLGKEAKAAAGSLEFLREKVELLRKKLESAPQSQVPKILGDLISAEKELEAVEERFKSLRNELTNARGGAINTPLSQLPSAGNTGDIALPDLSGLQVESEKVAQEKIKGIREDAREDELKAQIQYQKDLEKIQEEAAQREKEFRAAVQDALFDSAAAGVQAIADERQNDVNEELESKLTALDIEYEKRKEAAQGNAQLLAKIEKDYEQQKADLELQAAKERKRIAIIESAIAGALAVVKALPNVPLAVATGIAAAAQTAIIASKKFAFGGFTGKGAFADETGERVVNATVHEGEYVAPRTQVQAFPTLFKWLNEQRPRRGGSVGTGFAFGGYTTPPAISFSSAKTQQQGALSIEANAVIDKESVYFIAREVAKEVYNATAQGINDADRTNERKQRLTELTNV